MMAIASTFWTKVAWAAWVLSCTVNPGLSIAAPGLSIATAYAMILHLAVSSILLLLSDLLFSWVYIANSIHSEEYLLYPIYLKQSLKL
jgi:hypothetical protein